jgi:hypothetical protein
MASSVLSGWRAKVRVRACSATCTPASLQQARKNLSIDRCTAVQVQTTNHSTPLSFCGSSSQKSSSQPSACRASLPALLPHTTGPPSGPLVCLSCRPACVGRLGRQVVLLGPAHASTRGPCAVSHTAWQGVQPDSNQQSRHCGHIRAPPRDLQHQPVSCRSGVSGSEGGVSVSAGVTHLVSPADSSEGPPYEPLCR